jgi:hypothetical protein
MVLNAPLIDNIYHSMVLFHLLLANKAIYLNLGYVQLNELERI